MSLRRRTIQGTNAKGHRGRGKKTLRRYDRIACPAWKRHPSVLLARALAGSERQRRVSGVLFLHPVPVAAPRDVRSAHCPPASSSAPGNLTKNKIENAA